MYSGHVIKEVLCEMGLHSHAVYHPQVRAKTCVNKIHNLKGNINMNIIVYGYVQIQIFKIIYNYNMTKDLLCFILCNMTSYFQFHVRSTRKLKLDESAKIAPVKPPASIWSVRWFSISSTSDCIIGSISFSRQ